ncbi:MAG: invasin domain 3-containing protein [Dehalococcoidia bacterium]
MKLWNGRLVGAMGALLAVAGLVAFSLSSSQVALGGDTGLPTDVDATEGGTLTVDPSTTTAAAGESVVLTITVNDANGDPVEGADCVLGVTSQPGITADVSPDEAVTDANGQIAATLDAGETEGTVTVEVNCGSLSTVLDVAVGGAALPPGSLPQAGIGYPETGSSAVSALLVVLLAALGVTLLGTGAVATRTWRARD